jgi:asparagine synthase (glutamine-hydrolysing)
MRWTATSSCSKRRCSIAATWSGSGGINNAARERGLNVLLTGQMGNMGLSYGGFEFLPELLRAGAPLKLLNEALKLRRSASKKAIISHSLGPFFPAWLWQRINRFYGRTMDVFDYTAIRPQRLSELDLPRLAKERNLDLSYRPRVGAFESRMWVLGRIDMGNYQKGMLAGWGIDQRDPTADRRLFEYCLQLPMGAFISDGRFRALASLALEDRLPTAVLRERRKGYQGVDWHEALHAARGAFDGELERLTASSGASRTLDLDRLKRLMADVPKGGWARQENISAYRLALYRGVSAGHFLRKAEGGNS